jgi:hypothetical protein
MFTIFLKIEATLLQITFILSKISKIYFKVKEEIKEKYFTEQTTIIIHVNYQKEVKIYENSPYCVNFSVKLRYKLLRTRFVFLKTLFLGLKFDFLNIFGSFGGM